ncbi:phosphonomutase [Enemella evansiae]|uniref:isocitrate lyase/PEP mutase family protein n=1 Tax=Enemella evansiae TaxID=2016499 RepID=UPI000B970BDB|nr:isocitrate lyase/phosphoenolpyruvate mutase family protein [Enemella evansiae]OYO08359.1 phosphonomutase [Enemella evansiae]
MSTTQQDAGSVPDFTALHVPGAPLVLVNVWDAGSARIVATAGATAIATGSWSVAAAMGLEDGEQVSVANLVALTREIAAAADTLPLTVDAERGYADTPSGVADVVAQLAAAGAVGCNLEDGTAAGGVRPVKEQAEVLTAVRERLPGFHVNARTDLFLNGPAAEHRTHVEDAIARGRAYAAAGASSFFVPGLVELPLIERIVAEVPLPVNVMVLSPDADLHRRLAAAGVARISHGPAPYLAVSEALAAYTRTVVGAVEQTA